MDETAQTKRCPHCGEEKAWREFARHSARRDGLQPHCRECKRRYREKNREAERDKKLRRAGWTLEKRLSAYAAQGGCCAVCKRPCLETSEDGTIRNVISSDHCHVTGLPRGLLCGWCNIALGKVRDDSILLLTLACYADGWAARHRGASEEEINALRQGVPVLRAVYEAWRAGKLAPFADTIIPFLGRPNRAAAA